MGQRYSGSRTQRGQPGASLHQGAEILLRTCPLASSLSSRTGKWCPRGIPNLCLPVLPDFRASLGLLYCPNPSWVWIKLHTGSYLYLGALIGVSSSDVQVSQDPEVITTLPAALGLEPHCRRGVLEAAISIPIIHGEPMHSFKGCPTVVHAV